jgi:hypothetical protein
LAYSKGGKKKKSKKRHGNLTYIIDQQNIILDKNISNSIKIHWPYGDIFGNKSLYLLRVNRNF